MKIRKYLQLTAGIILLTFGLIGCATQKVTPANPATNQPAVTNYVPNEALVKVVGVATKINDATAAADPYSGAITWGLGVALAVAGWIAKRKNDQAAAAQTLTKTVIQGVEAADNPAVKLAIQTHATAVGVEGALSQVVFDTTK